MTSFKLRSKPFSLLVAALKKAGKTCTVVESSCGGLINASIMAVPGSSQIYYGGSVAYNTKKSLKFLLNDSNLHNDLMNRSSSKAETTDMQQKEIDEAANYIQSKLYWTEQTAIAFCEQLDVDYAIAEGGATGPTFRPNGMDKGFAVIAIAGRRCAATSSKNDKVELLAQTIIRSDHANRQENMRFFADAAATFAVETIDAVQSPSKETICLDIDKDANSSFTDTWLDRATHLRSVNSIMEKLEQRADARFVVLRNANECLIHSTSTTENSATLALVDSDNPLVEAAISKTFLGILRPMADNGTMVSGRTIPEGVPIFGLSIGVEVSTVVPPGTEFCNTRTHAPILQSGLERELVWYATAMAQWRKTHTHCSSCGSRLEPLHGGTCLKCTNQDCQAPMSWPRQDPSIIVVVTNRNGNKVLLARSKRHPARLHTTLAGFVEAGETMEDAVSREVFEETGVQVDAGSITYVTSQPWPFPRSTMIAFQATANDDLNEMPIQIDEEEIVSASWFDREDVAAAAEIQGAVMDGNVAEQALQQNPSLRLLIPPKGVVARALLDKWLDDD